MALRMFPLAPRATNTVFFADFAPQKARKPLIQQVNFGNGHGMPLPQHSSPGSRLRGGPWRHQKSKHKASTETITLRCCTVPDKHTRPTPLDAHAVLPELGHASGTGGPLGDSRSVQPPFLRHVTHNGNLQSVDGHNKWH